MGTYAAGNATKERIKDAARVLFYTQGVSAVSDSVVCREAAVQRGLAGYHFGNRGGLVAAIYQEYVEALRDTVAKRFPTDDPALAYCILEYLLVDMLRRNREMRRFYVEIIQFPEVSDEEVRVQHEQLARILTRGGKRLDTERLKIAVALSQGAFNELVRCIEIGYLDDEVDQAIIKDLRITMLLAGVDEEERQRLVDATLERTRGRRLAIGKAMRPRVIALRS